MERSGLKHKRKAVKRIIPIILLSIFATETYCQKVYLTREGLQRLNKRLEHCEIIETKLVRATKEITDLKRTLTDRELEFLEEKAKLDSIIAKGQEDYEVLEKRYERVLKLVPKKKRKYIDFKRDDVATTSRIYIYK